MSPKPSAPILWVTDTWETLDHKKDTTLRLAQESLSQGQNSYWCDYRSVYAQDAKILLEARKLIQIPKDRDSAKIKRAEPRVFSPGDFSKIHYRPDPPVDLGYLHPLQLLWRDIRASNKTEIVNPAPVLILAGEKLEALKIPKLSPPSIASSHWELLQAFGKKLGRTVLKPLNSAQSKGIELIDWSNSSEIDRARALIEGATNRFKLPVLLQRYLPEISDGEHRLWFLDGTFLASVQKLPLAGDFRVNLDRGSQVVAKALGQREKKAIPKISRHLKSLKIRLAAVDLIGGLITDFNFTSPGLLTTMEEVLGTNLALPITKKLAKRWL